MTLRGNYANETRYTRLSAELERGWLLPLDHSSLWFRAAGGTSLAGRRVDQFGDFFFGGFGNNWVDHRSIKQFRETESFAGLDINEVGGANYARAQLEWTTPPLRFRSVGGPSFYLRWATLSLFSTGMLIDMDDAALRQELVNAGLQLDVRVVTLSHLDSTFSLGFATAWAEGLPARGRLMFSFKIM